MLECLIKKLSILDFFFFSFLFGGGGFCLLMIVLYLTRAKTLIGLLFDQDLLF